MYICRDIDIYIYIYIHIHILYDTIIIKRNPPPNSIGN